MNDYIIEEVYKILNKDLKCDFSKLKRGCIISFDEIDTKSNIEKHYEKEKIHYIDEISISLESNKFYFIWKKFIINLKIEEELNK